MKTQAGEGRRRAGPGGEATAVVDTIRFTDAEWLAAAVTLATSNVAGGGSPLGAFVVRDDVVLGRGVNRVTRDNDPTAHAEVCAIRAACTALDDFSLASTTLYASSEPCPLCLAGRCGRGSTGSCSLRTGTTRPCWLRRPRVLRAVRRGPCPWPTTVASVAAAEGPRRSTPGSHPRSACGTEHCCKADPSRKPSTPRRYAAGSRPSSLQLLNAFLTLI